MNPSDLLNLILTAATKPTKEINEKLVSLQLGDPAIIQLVLRILYDFKNDLLQPNNSFQLEQVLRFLKNCLVSKNVESNSKKREYWIKNLVNGDIHTLLIDYLTNIPPKSADVFAQVIGIIASYEMPNAQWPDLIPQLTSSKNSLNIQIICLKILTTIFEKVNDSDLMQSDDTNKIIGFLFNDIGIKDKNYVLEKLKCIKSLLNLQLISLQCFGRLFEILVIKPTEENMDTFTIKFDSYSFIVDNYYDCLSKCKTDFINSLINSLNFLFEMYSNKKLDGEDLGNLCKKIFDVWTTVGKVEVDKVKTPQPIGILQEAVNKFNLFEQIKKVIQIFAQDSMKEEDDDGEDLNNVIFVSQQLISYIGETGGINYCNQILSEAGKLINSNEVSQYLSLIYFDSIIEIYEDENVLAQFVKQILPRFNSNVLVIKITTIKTLIKILDNYPNILTQYSINLLMESLKQIGSNTVLDIHLYSLIGTIYDKIDEPNALQNQQLTSDIIYNTIIQKAATTKEDNILRSLFSCLQKIICNLDKVHNIDLIYKTFVQFPGLIPKYSSNSPILSILIEIIGDCVESLPKNDIPKVNWNDYIKLILGYLEKGDIYDSCMKAIVQIASVLSTNFGNYIEPVIKCLINILVVREQNEGENEERVKQCCKTIEDLSLAVKTAMNPYVPHLLNSFGTILQKEGISHKTKIYVITAISSLAAGVGFNNYKKFFEPTFNIVTQLANNFINAKLDLFDEDSAEFYTDMVKAIMITCSRLFKGCDDPSYIKKIQVVLQLTLNIHKSIQGKAGYADTDAIYDSFCEFYLTLVKIQFIGNNPEGWKQTFIGDIVSLIRICDSNIQNEDLRINVEDLKAEFIKKGV